MTDREKVIESLNKALTRVGCGDMDNVALSEVEEAIESAIALLKEQEKPDCKHAEHDGIGCLGYAGCAQDDEPIDVCKFCREYTGNRYEEVNGDV